MIEYDFDNTNQVKKVKVENVHSQFKNRHITKQLLTTISVDTMIYLPIKVIITKAARSR